MVRGLLSIRVQCVDSFVSLSGFILGATIYLFMINSDLRSTLLSHVAWSAILQICFVLPIMFCIMLYLRNIDTATRRCPLLDNCWRAYFLGCIFGVGLFLALGFLSVDMHNDYCTFGVYLAFLAFFHWSEFYFTAVYNSSNCSIDIYMLSHSTEYVIALAMSVLEYWLEKLFISYFYPNHAWNLLYIKCVGSILCVSGEILRKLALFTAGENFNHFVQFRKKGRHQLVTGGVYSFCRHPAYVGWFCWCVGTQVLLINPVCMVAYTLVAFTFFKHRIYEEERALVHFFGEDYREYQKVVPTGIPFIYGYISH